MKKPARPAASEAANAGGTGTAANAGGTGAVFTACMPAGNDLASSTAPGGIVDLIAKRSPFEAMTPGELRARWAQMTGKAAVLGFYGHSRGEHRCFSNFYDQSAEPFDFEVPGRFLGKLSGSVLPVVSCDFSEKAIMLCKAAVMGDQGSYHKIAAARDPRKAKALGRAVQGFVPQIWDEVVCSVAFAVVYQKFAKTQSIQGTLLRTGDCLIAEATARDANWGIGIDMGDARVQTPTEWAGSNILGWALMEARGALRSGGHEPLPAEAAQRPKPKRRWGGE